MAQKAFIIGQDPPSVVDGNIRIDFPVIFVDSETGDAHNHSLTVDFDPTSIGDIRTDVRNKIQVVANTFWGWNLGNGDVYFMAWTRELL